MMSIPKIIPVAVLASLGLFVLARRGRAEDDEPEVFQATLVYVPDNDRPEDPTQTPGRMCRAHQGEAAWDDTGECKVFWIDGETDEAIVRLARDEWEARGKPTFSAMCLAVEDPLGGEFATPIDNPMLSEIVQTALERYYDVGALWPPKEDNVDASKRSPYWVWKTWASAMAVVRRELCPQ